jgi:hypothetical protein
MIMADGKKILEDDAPRPAHKIKFDALRNALYHTYRRAYLDGLNRGLSFFVVLFGATAAADVEKLTKIPPEIAAAIAALAGLFQLVFDLGGLARTHEFLQRRFYELLAEVSKNLDADPRQRAEWDVKLNEFYAEEPPMMRALDAIAYNAAWESLGKPSHLLKITAWQSLMRNLIAFNSAIFPNREPVASASAGSA